MTAKAYFAELRALVHQRAREVGIDPATFIDRVLLERPPPPGVLRLKAQWFVAVEMGAVGRQLTAEANAQMELAAFAEKHGCPSDVPVLPWLLERGLVRQEGDRLVYVEPDPDDHERSGRDG